MWLERTHREIVRAPGAGTRNRRCQAASPAGSRRARPSSATAPTSTPGTLSQAASAAPSPSVSPRQPFFLRVATVPTAAFLCLPFADERCRGGRDEQVRGRCRRRRAAGPGRALRLEPRCARSFLGGGTCLRSRFLQSRYCLFNRSMLSHPGLQTRPSAMPSRTVSPRRSISQLWTACVSELNRLTLSCCDRRVAEGRVGPARRGFQARRCVGGPLPGV